MNNVLHIPVLLAEVTKYLDPAPGKQYIDATLGYAGHTLALLERGADVVGIDQDADLLELATARISATPYLSHFTPLHSSFSSALSSSRLPGESFNGVLFDLGVSSYQLDTPDRGFSFRYDAPLDMRMNRHLTVTAKDLINGLGKQELLDLLTTLGEVGPARRIVAAICTRRRIRPITTTLELASLVERTVGHRGRIHPATQVFQALRMAVNSEREELKAALPSALSKLRVGGVLAVIAFHSLEDEPVKAFFQVNPGLSTLTPKPVRPSAADVAQNPRCRSAKLRVGRKV